MLRARSRVLLRFAAVGILMLATANSASGGAITGPLELHREAVDELRLAEDVFVDEPAEVGPRDAVLLGAHGPPPPRRCSSAGFLSARSER